MNSIHISHPGFDDEDQIIRAGNRPSPVDLASFQKQIDGIVGKTTENRSRLRVVWGQSRTALILGRERMTYPFYRYEEGGEIRDIGTPRFYVEELHDMAELRAGDGWEKARYQWDGLKKLDVLGPIPEDGFYTCVFTVAHHDDLCCKGKEIVNGNPCLGAYRPPTDADLTRIRRMLQRRNEAGRMEQEASAELLTKWSREAGEKRDEKWREGTSEAIKDWMAVHGHRITDSTSPKLIAHGKYKFMPQTSFNKS